MKILNIDGYIVHKDDKWIYDMFGVSSVTQGDIRQALTESDGEDIQLNIDCYGGNVFVASDIYSDLRAYKGKTTANVTGISASASTVLMLGCQKVIASPTAQFMMHLASTSARGNRNDMTHAAEELKVCDESIINAYEIKTGLDRETLNGIMEKETWMTAQQAKKYGFVDEIDLKEGESLSETQITAVMAATNRVYNMALKPDAMKNIANMLTADGITLPKTPDEPTDNGGVSQPVTDKQDLTEQNALFNSIKRKLINI